MGSKMVGIVITDDIGFEDLLDMSGEESKEGEGDTPLMSAHELVEKFRKTDGVGKDLAEIRFVLEASGCPKERVVDVLLRVAGA